MDTPTPEDVRAELAHFDARSQKVVTGLVGLMMQHPDKVREREWMAEQLTQLTLLAGEFEADSTDEAVRAVQEFLREHAAELLEAAFKLFHRVALDLQPRAAEGFSFEDAMKQVLGYMPPA